MLSTKGHWTPNTCLSITFQSPIALQRTELSKKKKNGQRVEDNVANWKENNHRRKKTSRRGFCLTLAPLAKLTRYKVRIDLQKLQVFRCEHGPLSQIQMQPCLWLLVRQRGLEERWPGGFFHLVLDATRHPSYCAPNNLPGGSILLGHIFTHLFWFWVGLQSRWANCVTPSLRDSSISFDLALHNTPL